MRYFLELSYDGTLYAGWQKQPNSRTIQGCIEEALKLCVGLHVPIYGCGRTDKGVHATYYIAHLDLPGTITYSCDDLVYKLNRILDKDISCHRLYRVSDDAHARYDALKRSYTYSIHTFKSPFNTQYSTYISYVHRLDVEAFAKVAELIQATSNFQSFCKLYGSSKSMLCHISDSQWEVDLDRRYLRYKITADRFLRGMVRLIVGSSLAVSSGKMTIDELDEQIKLGTRTPYMSSAPPQGLALCNVTYASLNS